MLGVIPARGGSQGIPGKNLRLLGGQPLIVHTIEAARESRLLGDFLVSTDDPAIADVARQAGASVPFMRPPELATAEVSAWRAASHAADEWERLTGKTVENLVLLQPTSPLRRREDIDGCIARFHDTGADICSTVTASHHSPYFNMVEPCPESPQFVRPCSALMLDHAARQTAPPVYALNGAVYVARRAVLPGLRNQFEVARYAVYVMSRLRSVDIDDLEDFTLAELILAHEHSRTIAGGEA